MSEYSDGREAAPILDEARLNHALYTLFEHILRAQDALLPAATTTGDPELRSWFVGLPRQSVPRTPDRLQLT